MTLVLALTLTLVLTRYDVALASGTVGGSVAREDVAKFMLTLATDAQYDNGAVSVGGNAPRTGH